MPPQRGEVTPPYGINVAGILRDTVGRPEAVPYEEMGECKGRPYKMNSGGTHGCRPTKY